MPLTDVMEQIRTAEADAGRPAGATKLIAVSKKQPRARIETVLAAGHRVFGENRVQEAADRWPPYREQHPDLELHLVGALQSNKVGAAVAMFDAIHSLDRPKLATRVAAAMAASGRAPELFVQVNTGEEPNKSGVLPADTDEFVAFCRDECELTIAGLMAIPPIDEAAALHFALLAKLAERNGLGALSMGMSADFETAIAFGATHVRIGTAVFGERESPPP